MKIGFIPIDNRPVCYTLPKLVAQIDKSLELILPERSLLGDLVKQANVQVLFQWMKNLDDVDAFVISLDTLAYGGLVSSRRCSESFDEIKKRLDLLKPLLFGKKVYAFSSIMRISNNNVNEEEKSYWDRWGKKIFEYSWNLHKYGAFAVSNSEIPSEILSDYLAIRKRNFEINKIYLEWQKEGVFDTLIFSKDDCAEFGFNVQEANLLKALGATIKTGADEIPLSLLARAIEYQADIKPVFVEPSQIHLISNYEDISINESVKNQIELAGFNLSADAETTILINNFVEKQGEIVMKVPTKNFSGELNSWGEFSAVADVRFTNGADNCLVEKLFECGYLENLLCFSAWNTSANSLGSLMLALKVILSSKSKKTFNKYAFDKFMLTRFLDDWAYQANVRQQLISVDQNELRNLMKPFEKRLLSYYSFEGKINYSFPWNRLFEVEIEFI